MTLRHALLALILAAFATVSFAGTTGTSTPEQEKVDCKKTPDHPKCKDMKKQ
jgi:hypothetical protein